MYILQWVNKFFAIFVVNPNTNEKFPLRDEAKPINHGSIALFQVTNQIIPARIIIESSKQYNCKTLRHQKRARIWTSGESPFSASSSQTDLWVTTVWKTSIGEACIKCHQNRSVALVFCTKSYTKLTFSPCSFPQLSFSSNFRILSWG